MNAQIKLLDFWKALNFENNPLKIEKDKKLNDERVLRSDTNGTLCASGITVIAKSSFINDGKNIWNKAPAALKLYKSLYSVKTEIKKFVKLLPL